MTSKVDIENVHQLITESVPLFFFVYDLAAGRIEYLSPQFMECVSNREDFQDLDPHSQLEHILVEEDLKSFHRFLRNLSTKNKFRASVELRTKRDCFGIEWIEINTFGSTKKTHKAQKVVGHILDTSLKKKQYEILHRENERLENFINMMAHDLKAPLANLNLVVDLLSEIMTPQETEKYGKYFEVILDTTRDSGELIKKLLHLAMLKGEASKLDLDLHDLREVVVPVVKMLKEHISVKELKISYDFPDYAVEALIDVTLFRQVILNLLHNAIKYTPKGGEIVFKAFYEEGRCICLSIKDSGIGIPEKYLSNLFGNVSLIKREGLDGEKSTGLGLYICQQIMLIHNGKIKVESQEDQGTTFLLLLPFPNSSAAYF